MIQNCPIHDMPPHQWASMVDKSSATESVGYECPYETINDKVMLHCFSCPASEYDEPVCKNDIYGYYREDVISLWNDLKGKT